MIKNAIIFFAITLVLTVVLAILQQTLNISFEQITIPQIAPTLAVFATVLIVPSLKTAFNFELNSTVFSKILLALLLPFALFGIGFLICQYLQIPVKITAISGATFPLLMLGMAVGAVGEEVGWRGFLQPNVEKKHAVLPATLLVGLLWGMWHIGHYSKGLLFLGSFLVFTIAASMVLRAILEGCRFNIVVAAAFHLGINICFWVFYKSTLADSKMMLVNALIWLVLALFLYKKDFFSQP
jgi:uncharacterized protein